MKRFTTRALVTIVVGAFLSVACGIADLDVAAKACPCGPGWACDTSRNVCVRSDQLASGGDGGADDGAAACSGEGCACVQNRDCIDPKYNKCNGGKCVECSTTPDSCPANQYCLAPFNECAPGCKLDTECIGLGGAVKFCNVQRHQCVECLVDGDCGGGKKCSPSGACVVPCTTSCAVGTCCNGLCIDTTTDPTACGSCTNACTGAQTACCNSQCKDPLTDVNNCGKCGTVCPASGGTASCQAGQCKVSGCSPGYGTCFGGTTCGTNFNTSTSHCGNCNTNCGDRVTNASGKYCNAGKCDYGACLGPYTDADGNRANGCENNTAGNCGTNGAACCAQNTCNAGLVCRTSTQLCGPD